MAVEPKLGVTAENGTYEVMPATRMDEQAKRRLMVMVRRARQAGSKLYIAREGDHWGVANPRLDSLARIYRDDPHDGFYEVSARWHENLRLRPDLFITPVGPSEEDTNG